MTLARAIGLSGGLLLAWLACALADEKLEQPVGLVLSSQDAMLLRAGTNLPLGAKPGDILFAGDSLQSDRGESAVFLFCPANSSQRLDASSEVELDVQQLSVAKGQLTEQKTAPICKLPLLERTSVAAEKHYGKSMEADGDGSSAPRNSLEVQLQGVADDVRRAIRRELEEVDAAIGLNPADLAAHVARAAILEKYGLKEAAADEYRSIQAQWPDAVWAAGRAFVDEERSRGVIAREAGPARLSGRTYALLVGISHYQSQGVPQLQFADADAKLLEQHLRSPRGGALSNAELTVLTNGTATLAAIRTAMDALLKSKAGKNDTVLLFFAGHGISTQDDGYILATDSNPEDLKDTAIKMSVVQNLFEEKLKAVGRVVLYVDVCHAGLIGSIRNPNKINEIVDRMADENEIFGVLASRKNQNALEGPEYGGHGVFSLYLVEGLNGAADKDHNGVIDAFEIALYVETQVSTATHQKQTPREIGNADTQTILADVRKEGLQLEKIIAPAALARMEVPAFPGSRGMGGAETGSSATTDDFKNFDEAIEAGRLLPGVDRSAFASLGSLQRDLPARQYAEEENRLRVALEDSGQQVLLTYLKGDEVPQTQKDFQAGAALFEAARQLTPESLLLYARQDFCLGRAALFDKDYAKGIGLLERAARIDTGAAYPYNALGIAYLEQAKYKYAVLAFRDAIRNAPLWAYPRYNLAITFSETGAYGDAEREYRDAIRMGPRYAYVHYALGALLHKLGRKDEAESEYRTAIRVNPKRPEPYVGLGAVEATHGRRTQAEENYRTAMRLDPKLPSAAHDLGLLYAKEGKRDLAIKTWEANLLVNPEFGPSRMSLAKAYRDERQYDMAIGQYRAVLAASAEYAAAAMALDETLGDRFRRDNRLDEARAAYRRALAIAVSEQDQKRIRSKLRR